MGGNFHLEGTEGGCNRILYMADLQSDRPLRRQNGVVKNQKVAIPFGLDHPAPVAGQGALHSLPMGGQDMG